MSRIISMMAKLSFLFAAAAVFAFAPAPAAAIQGCIEEGVYCPPFTDAECSALCSVDYPGNNGVSACYYRCICAC